MSGMQSGESVDRNKAIGYLIARAMAAEVLGNKERSRAFTEAAQILKSMPSIQDVRALRVAERLQNDRPR